MCGYGYFGGADMTTVLILFAIFCNVIGLAFIAKNQIDTLNILDENRELLESVQQGVDKITRRLG